MRWLRTITTTALAALLGGCFQVQLNGPVVNSTVSLQEMGSDSILHSATTWNRNNAISLVGQPTWDSYSGLLQLVFLGLYSPATRDLIDQQYYVVSASGGQDVDANKNQQPDPIPTAVAGEWRALATGADIKRGGGKVSALTEAMYQYVSPNLDNLHAHDLSRQLELLAQRVVGDVNGDGSVTYFDALQWNQYLDQSQLKADEAMLDELSAAIAAGETNITSLATAVVDSGVEPGGEWVYRFPRPEGNSFTCATCHALQEPTDNGFSRPGHPLGDATRRASYKDGQTTSMLEAVNSCLDEWMNADTWIESNPEWIVLEGWLDTLSAPEPAPPVDIQIAAIPTDLTGGSPEKGLQTFNESCAICHGRNGTGSIQAPAIGALGLDPGYVATRVRTSGRNNSDTYDGLTGGIMPFWGANRLSDEDLLDLVAMLELGEGELDVVSGEINTGTSNDECASDHAKVGQTAELITRFHDVTGTATLVDNCTIEITNFNYDGEGIVVQVYTGQNGRFDRDFGRAVSANLVGPAYNNVTLRISLPADMSLDDFDSISIWCVAVGISFGDAVFRF